MGPKKSLKIPKW